MKKRTGRLLSLLLVLALLLGLMPAAALAADGDLVVTMDDCTVIGTYMYEDAYLYTGPVPEGAMQVVFGDFAAEGSTITSMTATNTMLTDTNTAPLSGLFAYTREDAEHDVDNETLELSDDYAAYPFENCFGYFFMDEDYNMHAFFIVYEAETVPTEYDRSFTVTVGDTVVPETDIELVEDGYTYTDYAGKVTVVDTYIVTVPQGTETVLLTFGENRLAYNYTAAGDYLGGYYEDYQAGAATATVPLDYGDSTTQADGEIDYIQVQTPYDAAWNSVLLYAITFRYADEEPEPSEPEEPGKVWTPEEVRDNIAARYASFDFSGDGNALWFAADMMAYLSLFPETEARLSDEQKAALADKAIDALAGASSASDAAKSVIALAALGYDPTRLTAGDGSDLDGRETLDGLCFDGDALKGLDQPYYSYSLPYLMIAYQQLPDAEAALETMVAAALALKADWMDTTWGTDGLTPFLLALAPYAEADADVAAALEEALEALKAAQGADGSLGGSAASTGLALAGLRAIGVDPASICNAEGKSLVDGLMVYVADTGDAFLPTANSYSTEQGFRGLVALAGEAGYRIYDFAGQATEPGEASRRDVVFQVIPEDAAVTVTDAQGQVIQPVSGNSYADLPEGEYSYTVSLEGYESKSGTFTVAADSAMQTISVSLSRSEPEEEDGDDTVTIQVRVLAHDGETCGNALTYKSDAERYFSLLNAESYTAVLTAGVGTARDALLAALDDSGLSYTEESNGYFSAIGGYVEASHGARSGWMYLVDGQSPVVGAGDYVFEADAEMIWYFTDDYTGETGSEEFSDENEGGGDEDALAPGAVLEPEAEDTDEGVGKASVTAEEIEDAIRASEEAGGEEIAIVPAGTEGMDGVTVTVPKEGLEALAQNGGTALRIGTPYGELVLAPQGLANLAGEAGDSLQVTVSFQDGVTRVTLEMNGKDVAPEGGMLLRLPALGSGSVLLLLGEDGQETLVRKCALVGGRLLAKLPDSAALKIEDRAMTFGDTRNHWAQDAVTFVSARGLMTGVSEGSFAPDLPMSRAMFATVLFRLEDAAASAPCPFADVAEEAWYRDAVTWAAETGIVKGNGAGFDPNGAITREQLAVMLWRYAAYLGMDTGARGDLSSFADRDSISSWATDAIGWAVSEGLLNGKGDGRLDPGGNATRAEVATLLQRMITLLVK